MSSCLKCEKRERWPLCGLLGLPGFSLSLPRVGISSTSSMSPMPVLERCVWLKPRIDVSLRW